MFSFFFRVYNLSREALSSICLINKILYKPNYETGLRGLHPGQMHTMIIAAMTFRLYAPWVHSLKEKRMTVKSLLAQLINKFHVSAAETDEQDTHQIIVISIAAIVPHTAMADSLMDEISAFVDRTTEAEILDEQRELFT